MVKSRSQDDAMRTCYFLSTEEVRMAVMAGEFQDESVRTAMVMSAGMKNLNKRTCLHIKSSMGIYFVYTRILAVKLQV